MSDQLQYDDSLISKWWYNISSINSDFCTQFIAISMIYKIKVKN